MNGVIPSQDWANLKKYKKQNAKLGPPKANENRIVFLVIQLQRVGVSSTQNIFQEKSISTGVLVAKQHHKC